jgi:hypothetical protein
VRGILRMAGLALAAYAVGRQTAAAASSVRLAAVERRLAELEDERPTPDDDLSGDGAIDVNGARGRVIDKEYTAFHYEALASQALQEQRLNDMDVRLLEVELRRHDSRARRCADRQHATTGESRHG